MDVGKTLEGEADDAPEILGDEVILGMEYPCDPRYVRMRRWANLAGTMTQSVVFVVFIAFILTFIGWTSQRFLMAGLFVVLFVTLRLIWSIIWPRLDYQHRFYYLDEDGIHVREGVWWCVSITVPYSRIQHIDVGQGPFERQFELGHLLIHTAGTFNAEVAVVGLEWERAGRLKHFLLQYLAQNTDKVGGHTWK